MDFGNFGGDDPQQLRRGEMHSSRRSIVCSSVVDLSQLKEEAFELRPYGNAVGRKMTTESSRSLQRQAGRKRTTDRGKFGGNNYLNFLSLIKYPKLLVLFLFFYDNKFRTTTKKNRKCI